MKCFALLIAWLLLCLPVAAVEKVDVALVLAVDCSGSVDGGEYALQIKGIEAAFRDPAVIAAATNGPLHRIAVNLMTWGDPDERKYETGWMIISSPQASKNFAAIAGAFEQRQGGGTGIGNAISYGLTLLHSGEVSAPREVIDVSGDGHESWELREPHFNLADAQKLRAAAGVTVNGLAIMTDDSKLDVYYRKYVAGGPDSFVIGILNYGEFAEGIRRKLLQELNPDMASRQIIRARF
jgi:Protein of unknown function (DUF1194)